jgi:site-specific DNA-methyltransferase (adenine-specific)
VADFKSVFKSGNNERETPLYIFDPLNAEFNFTLDVCASEANKKCAKFFSVEQNGLTKDWGKEICWMNPPFQNKKVWVKKAYEASQNGAAVVCLLPARTNTNWRHDYCMKGEIRFIRGRVVFVGAKHGLPQPLAIVVFRPKGD